MLRVLIALTLCTLAYGFVERIPEIIDTLWDALDKDDTGIYINVTSYKSFFKGYESRDPLVWDVEVDELDFILGWLTDFGGVVDEASGYFRILSLDGVTPNLLTERDLDLVIRYCDNNWDETNGFLEYYTHMPGLFRPITWSVIFVRYDLNANEIINRQEFNRLADEWDENLDGMIELDEFVNWWFPTYGNVSEAEGVHDGLDYSRNGLIEDSDLNLLWLNIDGDTSGSLDFNEFITIDFVINGWPLKKATQKEARIGALKQDLF